ncbi:MAG: GHMP kinase [Pseudomonadota bacterium]
MSSHHMPADATGARAPGKLILSGEHSVVYGAPALAVAVERFTEIWFTPLDQTGGLRTAFESLSPSAFYPFDVLKGFAEGLDRRFDEFMRGELPVQKILQRPDDLAIYTLTSLLPVLPVPGGSKRLPLPLPVPGQLSSRSDMPLGAGMGSSAAVVAATVVLYEHLLGRPQSVAERFAKVRFCERLQHGKGSAIDASAVVYGGLNRVEGDAVQSLDLPLEHSLSQGQGWYWVLQGTPVSKTGECVARVREAHGQDKALWAEFEAVTRALESVLAKDGDPTELLRSNHRLLMRIGVVPQPAQRFAAAVESLGGAAKISGAGAVRGEAAGVTLVYLPEADAMARLMEDYPDRRWEGLRVSRRGAHLCDDPGAALPAQAGRGAADAP